jgi:hypothetical protein
LEDVWKVPEPDITKINDQTKRALKQLEDSEYFSKAKVIVDSIDKRMNEILVKQNDASISREEHIGAFRVNQMILEQVKQDVSILEKMLLHTGAPPSIELLKDTVFEEKKSLDRITAWKLIFAIIAFLGFLGFGFYIRWFLLVKGKKSNAPADLLDNAPSISEHLDEHVGLKPVEVTGHAQPGQDKRKAG